MVTRLVFIGLLVSTAIGSFAAARYLFPAPSTAAVSDGSYQYINPTVTSDLNKHFIINFKPLRKSFEEIQAKYPQKTYIYFLYLNNSSWVGINEREDFTAASTIKVPVAMAVMKAVEEKKLALTDVYTLEELDLDDNFGDLYKEGAGTEWTVAQLIELMLRESDNTALDALVHVFERIGVHDTLGSVYGFLGWEFVQDIPDFGETPNYSKINLKTLTNLFLALYDAKYVNIEYSNLILGHLANTEFNDRIDAGVPDTVPVSHKIGTAVQDDTYSDCGIVYAPNRHYILCVGSAGASEQSAARFMAEISKAAYTYVINN